MKNNGRLEWLDAFRGLAALAVVLFHFHAALGIPRFDSGFLAVDMFFVLSGIVLGKKYDVAIREGMSFREFAWQRIRRLYPMAIISAGLITIIGLAGIPDEGLTKTGIGTTFAVLFVFPYSPDFPHGMSFPANAPVWSLWAELMTNIVWFFALKVSRKLALMISVLVLLTFLVITIFHGSLDVGAHAGFVQLTLALMRSLGWFGVGYLIALRTPTIPIRTFLLVLLLGAACALQELRVIYAPVAEIFVIATGALLLAKLATLRSEGTIVSRVCSFVGALSYPLYMIHFPAQRIAEWAASHGESAPAAYCCVTLAAALLAMHLNEWIIRRLPVRSGGFLFQRELTRPRS